MRLLAIAVIGVLILSIALLVDFAPEPTTHTYVYGNVVLVCERSQGPGFIRDACELSGKK